MKILALDMATRTGWALLDGARLESGVEAFPVGKVEPDGARFVKFRRFLNRLYYASLGIPEKPLDLVICEIAHHRGGAATRVGVGMMTVAQMFAAELGIRMYGVHTLTLKKYATGTGTADKNMMIYACRERLGVDPIDDNHADALWLLDYARTEVLGE